MTRNLQKTNTPVERGWNSTNDTKIKLLGEIVYDLRSEKIAEEILLDKRIRKQI